MIVEKIFWHVAKFNETDEKLKFSGGYLQNSIVVLKYINMNSNY